MNICDNFNGKRILIWGYGREGKSTELFLNKFCRAQSINILEGKREEFNLDDYDYVFKSPGIVCDEEDSRITSQTEVFLQAFGKQTIGITGTKGKSTTSSLLYTALNKVRGNAILLGNIGEPCLNYYGDITDDTLVVFEMSCHQLAHIKHSPHIAVFLNFYEEHLDYYKTLDKYFSAKANIAKYQTADDYFFVGGNVPKVQTNAKTSVLDDTKQYEYQLSIEGVHNRYNAEFVKQIACGIFMLDEGDVRDAMKEFKGLPHRLEFVGNYKDIDFYDDSISTIPEAAIGALNSLKNVKTILIGGMDRGIDYSVLIDFVKKHQEYIYIFMYESGARVYEAVSNCDYCYKVADLNDAVNKAFDLTPAGKACVMSPAAASYGYFKNFEERGEVFKSLLQTKKVM